MTPKNVERTVDDALGRMTLDEKIGQCLTQSWRGGLVTPSVVETIQKLHCGGLRIEAYNVESALAGYYGSKGAAENWQPPEGYFKVTETYFRPLYPGFSITAREYARRLNELKKIAMERPSGVPLHICTDFEGDFSHDFPWDGVNIFPANMGIRAAGSQNLAYKVGLAVGRQLSSIGVDMLHSPVCDVNINPKNPEINIRSFSDDPDVFCKYVVQFHRGLEEGGIIATAKHYPGRGDSAVDAHDALPVLRASRSRIERVELAPYRALIASGLRAVMSAHNAYPALDRDGLPASLSRRILVDVLREQLGFEGVITTDAIGMGAIVQRWGVPVASAMALKAGANLVLLKFDGELRSQAFFEIKRWVDEGRLTEDEIDASVARVLRMKAEQGLFENGGQVDLDRVEEVFHDEGAAKLCRDVSRRACMIIRDRDGLLPLTPDKKVLVIEQMIRQDFVPDDMHYHAHSFNEAVLEHSVNVVNSDCEFSATDEEIAFLIDRAKEVDVVLMTNYYWRVLGTSNSDLLRALRRRRIPVVIVTNNPYPTMGAPKVAGTVVCTYGVGPEALRAAAGVVFGKLKSRGRWPLEHTPQPE